MKALLLVSLALCGTMAATAQDAHARRFTIDSCVNQFNRSKAESTQVGYQYWFADKDFLDGRTLKLSVVAPHSATHPPMSIRKMNSSLSSKARRSSFWTVRPGPCTRMRVVTPRPM